MSQLADQSGAREGETAYEWGDGTVVYQRECPHCDKGLLYSPVRFCAVCNGDGKLLRFTSTPANGSVT